MRRLVQVRHFALSVAVILLWCCGSGSISFTPEDDAAALNRVQRAWQGKIGEEALSLSLCEDTAKNADFIVDDCTYAHLVRSENPTPARTIDRASGGCESCFFGVLTHVRATLGLTDGSTLQLTGLVSLGTAFEEDPYAGDYGLLLYADEGMSDVALEGRIQADGTLILSGAHLYDLGVAATEAEVSLTQGEANVCCGGEG